MRYLKAITALVTTGIGSFLLANESNGVSDNEWAWLIGVTFVATAAVFGVPNSGTSIPQPRNQ